MANQFELGGGSIPGGDHLQRGNLLIGVNNHDAFATYPTITGKPFESDLMVSVVADGCGSKPSSEVGSGLGCRLVVSSLCRQWRRFSVYAEKNGFELALAHALEETRKDVLAQLRVLITSLAGENSFSSTVNDSFLFTLVGALVAPEGAGFFSIGDGLIVVNGEVLQIGPFERNEPPYIAYSLYPSKWQESDLRFVVHRTLPAEEFESFLIGSDGAFDLSQRGEVLIPGSEEPIGPFDQFWTEDRFFTKTGIKKKLKRINSTTHKLVDGQIVVDKARVEDDVTMVVGRHRPCQEEVAEPVEASADEST